MKPTTTEKALLLFISHKADGSQYQLMVWLEISIFVDILRSKFRKEKKKSFPFVGWQLYWNPTLSLTLAVHTYGHIPSSLN